MSQDFDAPESDQTPEDDILAPATPFAGGAVIESNEDTASGDDEAPDEDVLAPATPFAGGAAVEPTPGT